MSAKASPKSKRLLWIDDEWPRQRRRRHLLEQIAGKENLKMVQTAEEAEEALQGEERFDAVLLDIMLPQNTRDIELERVQLDAGIELLEHLKSGDYPAIQMGVPVVVLTARGNREALERIRDLLNDGRDMLIPKPVTSEEIEDAVRNALGTRDANAK